MPQGANSPQPQQGQTGNPYQVTENRFWNFVPATGTKPPEMLLYGPIASQRSWWEDRVTPAQFNQELAAMGDVEELVVRINSGGGDVFAAHAIYCRLRDMSAKITVKIDGWCASAATIIAMAGDVIQIPRSGVFMIHDPAMTVWDTYKAADFEKLAQELKVIKQSIVNAYAGRTKMKEEDIAAMMQEETWWTGDQAVEKGFCDSVMFEVEPQTVVENARKVIVNSVPLDLSRFKTVPTMLLNSPAQGGLQNTETPKGGKEPMDGKEKITTASALEAAYPELVNQIRTEAVNGERARIKGIMDTAPAGYESIVEDALFKTPVDAGQVALKIVAAMKQTGAQHLAGVKDDAAASGMDGVEPGGTQTGGGDDGKSIFDRAIEEVL